MYARVIVNELNEIVAYCSDLNRYQVAEILYSHPDYKITCVMVG